MDAWMQCTAVSGRRLQAATREEKKKTKGEKSPQAQTNTVRFSQNPLSRVVASGE
jgi:hypothetical protein